MTEKEIKKIVKAAAIQTKRCNEYAEKTTKKKRESKKVLKFREKIQTDLKSSVYEEKPKQTDKETYDKIMQLLLDIRFLIDEAINSRTKELSENFGEI